MVFLSIWGLPGSLLADSSPLDAGQSSEPPVSDDPAGSAASSVGDIYPVGAVAEGVAEFPRGLALDPKTGFLWVSSRGTGTVTVFDHAGVDRLTFGSEGTGLGQLSFPQGIAIAGKEVFVAEEGNHRVQVFNRSGTHKRMWGSNGSGPGQFVEPCDVEVVGNFVYVLDTGNSRVQVFTKSGNFVDQFGSAGTGDGQLSLACTGSHLTYYDGEIFISDSDNGRVAVFSVDGDWERNIGGANLTTPYGIDADATGQIWVADLSTAMVTVLDAAGSHIGDFGGPGAGIGTFTNLVSLAVDPSGKSSWTLEQTLAGRIQAFSSLTCHGELLTHVGTSYDDDFTTGPDPDVVHLGSGNDTVRTRAGADTVCGGKGSDWIRVGDGKDWVRGEKGSDTLIGDKGADELIGGDGADTIHGDDGGDLILGERGNDTLRGGGGPDTLLGGKKSDSLSGNRGDDALRGGSGTDTCNGGPGTDTAKGCETKVSVNPLPGQVEAVIPGRIHFAK